MELICLNTKTKILQDGTPICEVIPKHMEEVVILCHGLGGNKNFFHPLEEKLADINIGIISFDLPYHGERKNKYTTYTVKNCLKTIDNVYKYVIKQYDGIKVSFMGKSLGSLYLYAYLQQKSPLVYKVIFQCLPLNNKVKMTHDFFNNPKNTEKYFCVSYGRKMPKQLLDDLDELERHLSDITCIGKKNILFIHGTADNVASLDDVKQLCNKFNFNLYEIPGADHNFKHNSSRTKLEDMISSFFKVA